MGPLIWVSRRSIFDSLQKPGNTSSGSTNLHQLIHPARTRVSLSEVDVDGDGVIRRGVPRGPVHRRDRRRLGGEGNRRPRRRRRQLLLLTSLSPSETGEDDREGVAFAHPALRFSRARMAVRRDEESRRPPVMLFKLGGVLKIGALGPELAAELDGHVATSILVASG